MTDSRERETIPAISKYELAPWEPIPGLSDAENERHRRDNEERRTVLNAVQEMLENQGEILRALALGRRSDRSHRVSVAAKFSDIEVEFEKQDERIDEISKDVAFLLKREEERDDERGRKREGRPR